MYLPLYQDVTILCLDVMTICFILVTMSMPLVNLLYKAIRVSFW